MRRLIFFMLVATGFLFVACSPKSSVQRVSKKSLVEVLQGMEEQKKSYQYFSAKGRIRLDSEEMGGSGRCNIRMIRDSVIWMNFKKLGIEGARTLMSPDSCFVVYRRDNMYEEGTFEEYVNAYNIHVTFGELQNLIVGQFHIPHQDSVKSFSSRDYHQLSFVKEGISYEYDIRDDYNLNALRITDNSGRKVDITISDYDETGFSSRKELMIFTPEEGEAKMSISLSGVEFDVPKKIAFDIPDHYRKI